MAVVFIIRLFSTSAFRVPMLCVSSHISCDSLLNQFVPFRFAITFYKIFCFPSETTFSKFLIIHIQFKDVSNQRKSEA